VFQTCEHAQRRRLAAAGRAEQRHQRTGLNRQRQVMDGREGTEGFANILERDRTGISAHAVFSLA
jgi:hypothetical protein